MVLGSIFCDRFKKFAQARHVEI